MIRAEYIKRSPLRILEKAIDGGLGKGRLGIFTSRKGVGKTACLVHIATDKLFQGKPVIHVTYSSRVDYIINWYEDIFKEIARKRNLEKAVEVHDEIIKNRVIMNFRQDAAQTDKVLKSLEMMIEHGEFAADTVIVDGYDFSRSTPGDLSLFRNFAQRLGLEIWFSASLRRDNPDFDRRGVPAVLRDYIDDVAVLISLAFKEEFVGLTVVKNHDRWEKRDLPLRLDPGTLLIAE